MLFVLFTVVGSMSWLKTIMMSDDTSIPVAASAGCAITARISSVPGGSVRYWSMIVEGVTVFDSFEQDVTATSDAAASSGAKSHLKMT